MPHDLALLTNITMALVTAFVGGYLARRAGLPTVAGYLLAGMAIGPFTPGFVGDPHDIGQLAEMGVIFMMFGVGLHFSLRDLWRVRSVAVPGAILQMAGTCLMGWLLARAWGWTPEAGLVLGTALSIASTVVLLRGLMDHGLLDSHPGQVAVGWLVLEDLATILILVLMPVLLGPAAGGGGSAILLALGKTAAFVGLMLVVGKRFLPWVLARIAHTRSRELFILAVVAVALGTAMGAAWLFGVSLALGAFLAGVVVSESDLGHQAGEELIPFRDIFAVLFFVSVGMLVNLPALWHQAGKVLILTALVVLGKGVLTLLLRLVLPSSTRTLVVVAAGLSQIGEFSFLVGQAGLRLEVLTEEQYGLILATALLSILVNPWAFQAIPWVERLLRSRHREEAPAAALPIPSQDHVVVVGPGRVAEYVLKVLDRLELPTLVVERDPERAKLVSDRGVPTLVGDASDSEILTYAGLPGARALVVALPDQVAAELVVASARELAPDLPIIARAGTAGGARRLAERGARAVIQPELEGGLEVVRYTLLILGQPVDVMQRHADALRQEAYAESGAPREHVLLDELVSATRGVEIAWRTVPEESPVAGRTLAEADLRARTGSTVLALLRGDELLANPRSSEQLQVGDRLGLLGDLAQIQAAEAELGGRDGTRRDRVG